MIKTRKGKEEKYVVRIGDEAIVEIIASAGSAKSAAFAAIEEAEQGNMEEAYNLLEQARKELVTGHQAHTNVLIKSVKDEDVQVTFLMVHASNHLSNAELSIDFAEKLLTLYERVNHV